MADEEDEDDPHEYDGQVVLLLPPGLLRVGGGGGGARHGHLATVAVLHVLVDLGEGMDHALTMCVLLILRSRFVLSRTSVYTL